MDLKEQYDKLLKYCYMKTKDRFISEDIVQETFLRFWQSRKYEDTGKEMAYLYTIAREHCRNTAYMHCHRIFARHHKGAEACRYYSGLCVFGFDDSCCGCGFKRM